MIVAVVLGGAGGAFEELEHVKRHAMVETLIAVNDAAADYPGQVDYLVTLHPEHLPKWIDRRRMARRPEIGTVVAHAAHPLVDEVVDYRFPGMNASGSSGLFAALVALRCTDLHVVLCGVPMSAKAGHYFDARAWADVDSFRGAWTIAMPHLRERVRSMSGWTAELLGHPSFATAA